MRSTLVLDPGCSFVDLSQRFAVAGWRLAGRAVKPIVPDEPEHAVFERPTDRAFYTFNPVCMLRVLDCAAVTELANLPALPVVDADVVRGWLASPDERTVLRGILASSQLRDATLAPLVEAHRQHPRATIAAAAARIGAELRGAAEPTPAGREQLAQAQALAAIEILKEQLAPVLRGLAQDRDGSLVASLRPRPDDYARAFQADAVDVARAAYEALWATSPRVAHALPASRLECHIAPAGMLGYENPLSRRFPGGYRAIAPLLQPHRAWVAWKLIEPGHSAGMAYDGLVWLDDHWAWFPKPYRMLAGLV
jgi:hypothetical protein